MAHFMERPSKVSTVFRQAVAKTRVVFGLGIWCAAEEVACNGQPEAGSAGSSSGCTVDGCEMLHQLIGGLSHYL